MTNILYSADLFLNMEIKSAGSPANDLSPSHWSLLFFHQTESSRKEIAQKQKYEICLKMTWNTIKNMFDPPFRLQGVYASILYVYFRSKMQKKQYLRVQLSTGKRISTASLENSTDESAPSARFPTMHISEGRKSLEFCDLKWHLY